MKHLILLIVTLGFALTAFAQTAPTITTQPQGVTINPGSAGALTVTASSSNALSYRWFKNGSALADGSNLTGTSSATLSFSAAQAADAGSYAVIVSNSGGSVTSSAAVITVAVIYAPVITSAPTLTAPPNVALNYTVTASNSPTSYAATGLPAGLSLNATTGVITGMPSMPGIFSVGLTATNDVGIGSATLTLTVEDALPSYAARMLLRATGTSAMTSTMPATPSNMVIDATGNIFVADTGAHVIVKITAAGVMSVIAGTAGQGGSADGVGAAASFLNPGGVAIDGVGNLYVADTGNHTIRKITPAGVVTTIVGAVGQAGSADGLGLAARVFSPRGIAADSVGTLYVADTANHTIRKISPAGAVTTMAGLAGVAGNVDGSGPAARLNAPNSLVVDGAGTVYIADGGNNAVRKISPAGVVTTVASGFNQPSGIALGLTGNVFVADRNNNVIKEITAVGTQRNLTFTPFYLISPGPGLPPYTSPAPTVSEPTGLACDAAGNVYWFNNDGGGLFTGISQATPFFPITITAPPQNQHVVEGESATFKVVAAGGPINYAWSSMGLHRAGLTTALSFPAVGSDTYAVTAQMVSASSAGNYNTNAGPYTVIAYNAGGSVSATAYLTIDPPPPIISTQTSSLSMAAGQSTTLSVGVKSKIFLNPVSTFTYAWSLDGVPISGATSPGYGITSAQTANAGAYTVKVIETSPAGTSSAVSAPIVVTVTMIAAPRVAVQPTALTVRAGEPALFSVTAAGEALSYQWKLNGVAIRGATSSTLALSNVQIANGGSYSVVVSNPGGAIATEAVMLDVITTRLANLSARGTVGNGKMVTVGFVTTGSASKQLLVRGVGPTLSSFGLTGVVSAPLLQLFDGQKLNIGSNAGWGGGATLTDAFARVGAFALPVGSADSALLFNLVSGLYTAQITGVNGASGVGLAEIYEADAALSASRLINLSALGFVGTGGDVLIVGFVVTGNRPIKILVRAVGPTLESFSVAGALARPVLTLVDGVGKTMASNTGWAGDAELGAAFTQVGAFGLPATSSDAALLVTLEPGGYTALVSGVANATGMALVELYEVPQ